MRYSVKSCGQNFFVSSLCVNSKAALRHQHLHDVISASTAGCGKTVRRQTLLCRRTKPRPANRTPPRIATPFLNGVLLLNHRILLHPQVSTREGVRPVMQKRFYLGMIDHNEVQFIQFTTGETGEICSMTGRAKIFLIMTQSLTSFYQVKKRATEVALFRSSVISTYLEM